VKILVNTDTFEPLGGVELSTLQVTSGLVARGHDCHLLYATGGGGLEAQWRSVATSMTQVPGFTVAAARPWRTAHHLPPAIRAARRVAPEVVYANRAEHLLWALGAARVSDAGLLVHLRHHPFPAPLVRLLGRGATRYLAVSQFLKEGWVAAGLPSEAIDVVPNGIDPDWYCPPTAAERAAARLGLGVTDDRPVVLCYGRLSVDKGLPTLLDAWSARSQPQQPALLVLAGDADADVEPLLATAQQSVQHVPRRDDVRDLLHAADLVVLPATWSEPFGRVVIEAMAAGVPVIASRVGGIPEILTGRFAGQLVPRSDPAALRAAIERLLDWRRTEPDLGRAGREHVQRHFSLSATVDVVEATLARVARTRTDREVGRWSATAA
jgi:glycosyltransferase involved in cell wall biosynthesis